MENLTSIIVRSYNNEADTFLLGGKGKNLYLMLKAGYQVPEFFVVTNHAYDIWLGQKNVRKKINEILQDTNLGNPLELSNATKRAAAFLETVQLPEAMEEELTNAFSNTFTLGQPVAVRSSANLEDSRSLSFAGIFKTFLNVRKTGEVIKGVRDCFASVFTKQAVSYLRQNGKSIEDIKMSVVIQKMIPSEISGILLTADAIKRRQYLAIIDAIWGVGEAIVQGMVTPDTYTIYKHSLNIEKSDIQDKEKLLVCNPFQSGLETKEVPLERTHTSTLSEAQIRQLVSIGIQLENFFEYFQDIEWAIYKDEIYLLQSRPLAGSLIYQKEENHVA